MRKLKKITLIIITFVLMFGLTGCLNKNIRNLSDSEIIKQIQAKMKEEMDKINFEVNFDDYEFKVNTGVEIQSNFGTVTIKDKRYNYDPIEVYDGNFEVLKQEKIGINPIIFVAHGYQDYKEKEMISKDSFKDLVNSVINSLKLKGHNAHQLSFKQLVPYSEKKYAYTVDVNKLDEFRSITNYSTIFGTNDILSESDYVSFFNKKTTKKIDYNNFENKLKYKVVLTFAVSEVVDSSTIKNIQDFIQNENIIINVIEGGN